MVIFTASSVVLKWVTYCTWQYIPSTAIQSSPLVKVFKIVLLLHALGYPRFLPALMGLLLIFGLWEIHFQSPFLESAFSDTPGTNCYRLDSPRTKFWDRDLYTGALLGVALGINSCGETKKQDCVERRAEQWVGQNKDHGYPTELWSWYVPPELPKLKQWG